MNKKDYDPLDVDNTDAKHCICEDNRGRLSFTSSFNCETSDSSRSNSIIGVQHTVFGSNPAGFHNIQRSLCPQVSLATHNMVNGQVMVQPINDFTKTLDMVGRYTDSCPPATTFVEGRRRRECRPQNDTCFCGPGRKRYLIAFLCCACLTVVIGMRSEMLGIITNLNNTSPTTNSGGSGSLDDEDILFKTQPDDDNVDMHFIVSNPDGSMTHIADKNLKVLHNLPESTGEVKRQPTSLIFKPSEHRQMPWTKAIKNDVVENAIFFAYLITSPIGGYLTVNHDSSFLLGCSVAMTCGMNLFLPLVETIGNNVTAKFIMVIFLRMLQGLAEGCLIPAVFGVLRFWAPEAERSTLVCVAVIGVSLGPLIGLPVCAEIEKKWGWGVVFYIYANLGLIWCIFWWRLIDEKPDKDEKLGKAERTYLQRNITGRILNVKRRTPIPWQSIFRSRPVFAIFFTYAADDWTFQISSVCMQSFYQQIYDVDVERTIFLLSFPFLSRSIFVPIGGIFADFLRIKTSLSQTAIRKIFAGLGFGLKGIFFIALGFAPSEIYATVLLSLSLGFSGLAVAGYAVNVIDIAPNFSGLVMGFANSVSTFTGLLSTLIASIVVHKFGLDLKNGWRVALALAALSQFCAVVFYLIFASGDEQPWAYTDDNPANTEPVLSNLERLELHEAAR
ncbi:Vesicular glutamate transporter [Paragonimus heterotremus]|uniref:Vesicular glutamate transporter n=1 Tax=Paragonimus heterotremus TaxID=100268 RepID=A0A8J4SQS3_9TREM|nr:Vesicular glutamate transporter [Paragonimus heterotremus]